MNNHTNDRSEKSASLPTHLAKIRRVEGRKTTFERIGAAWLAEDGSVYVKLHGTQIVTDGFNLYPVDDAH
ncbi:hypothetical protein [Geminicoccus roseus]|uniref:hypothetical protein n=1 Tax=Geminicoccus roseus TaxID=404900 RepID=UPI00042A62B9|nr:hypothetical protein [Geminicoccus roseus]